MFCEFGGGGVEREAPWIGNKTFDFPVKIKFKVDLESNCELKQIYEDLIKLWNLDLKHDCFFSQMKKKCTNIVFCTKYVDVIAR